MASPVPVTAQLVSFLLYSPSLWHLKLFAIAMALKALRSRCRCLSFCPPPLPSPSLVLGSLCCNMGFLNLDFLSDFVSPLLFFLLSLCILRAAAQGELVECLSADVFVSISVSLFLFLYIALLFSGCCFVVV